MKISALWTRKNKMIKKLWLNQFAFSLFGLFVSSALSGSLCVWSGIFSFLFYLSVVGFAVIDDGQKDKILKNAGRGDGLSAHTGLAYAGIAFLPSVVVVGAYTVYTFFASALAGAFHTIWFLIVKFVLAGEILGIDVGLTNYTNVDNVRTTTALPTIVFFSEHAIFQLLFLIAAILLLGLLYRLAFCGVINFNTTDSSKKNV